VFVSREKANATIELNMNQAYFREFHKEWVRSLGKGWRIDRVMIPVFLISGLALAGLGFSRGQAFIWVPGLMSCFFAMAEALKGWRKRRRWILQAMKQPWSGKNVRIEVKDGALVQKTDVDGEIRLERRVGLVESPEGYFFRFQPLDDAKKSSVYVPHRAIQPTMSRDDFKALLS
jgi:hypothetical protein